MGTTSESCTDFGAHKAQGPQHPLRLRIEGPNGGGRVAAFGQGQLAPHARGAAGAPSHRAAPAPAPTSGRWAAGLRMRRRGPGAVGKFVACSDTNSKNCVRPVASRSGSASCQKRGKTGDCSLAGTFATGRRPCGSMGKPGAAYWAWAGPAASSAHPHSISLARRFSCCRLNGYRRLDGRPRARSFPA